MNNQLYASEVSGKQTLKRTLILEEEFQGKFFLTFNLLLIFYIASLLP